MMRYSEGQELSKIYFPGEEGGLIQIGSIGVTKIKVVMEPGQMGMVPWFEVWRDDVLFEKWNAALMLGAEYA